MKTITLPKLPMIPIRRIYYQPTKIENKKGLKEFVECLEEYQRVFIHDGKLCNCMDKPTHQITACWAEPGGNKIQISVIHLRTRELSKITLP